ncbi:DUF3558 family protein [Nocardioides sp. YIM 152315]|uniref:DUF3558 family protein n=1 Tax=Nocardioides sp. YIM 152315 TaxID=3031760 RepID=UPI0023DA5458|nr:DUF3558 family protein [Nocardioides sp. YIM 152315]MDF1604290.1 DUF3558 family protein [Nocardioides sp. YIM 152315]
MRARPVAVLVAAGLALAGCSSDDAPSEATSEAESAAANVGWSPCDDLTAATVGRLVGARVAERTGSVTEPRCTFVPKRDGGAAYDISYLWFAGGLDEALDAMGAAGAQLEPVDVDGADAARMVVRTQRSGMLVTGFVQTEGLVQSVNAVQVKPYDEDAVVAGARALMAELADGAPSSPSG